MRSPIKRSTSYKSWLKNCYGSQKERRSSYESLGFEPQPPLVCAEHRGGKAESQTLGFPGEFPFTRGVQPTMYRGRLWTMRQFSGFGLPKDTNKRFKYLLAQGQTGLSTAFDMPSLMGYDPDHERSMGEVGREGVSVASIEDMDELFSDIDLSQITVSMTINCTATIAMAFYFAIAQRRGLAISTLGGTIQNDMLKEFIAQKEWICPPRPSVKLTCDVIEFCSKEAPRFNPVSISGYHIREAGATAAQELAFTLADGISYVEHCIRRGMNVDEFGPRLSFFFDVHNDFFEEIAKLRAARRMWAHIMRDRFKAANPRTMMLKTHAQTAGVSLTAHQPTNNVARVALQALAAVLGGVQSLHTNSLDETLALPTEAAARVALRTQQIIAEESGVTNTIDPLGGSYFVEDLTDRIEARAYEYLAEIDRRGGMLEAVEQGYPQREIAESSFRFQQQVEAGERTIVGVNKYTIDEGENIPTLKVDHAIERAQIRRIKLHKSRRNKKRWSQSLKKVEQVCREGSNVMPALIEAVAHGATLGEVSDVYRKVFGVYSEKGII